MLPGATPACATPTSAGACANGYRESVIAADVQLPDGAEPLVLPDPGPRVPTAFGSSVPVSPGQSGAQHNARVAAYAGNVYVVWEDGRDGRSNVFLAVSQDGGMHFAEQRVSDNVPGAVMELRPALAVSRDGADVFVAWQEFCAGSDDDCGRIKLARFDASGTKRAPDVRADQGAE